jgi:hypothetical protein
MNRSVGPPAGGIGSTFDFAQIVSSFTAATSTGPDTYVTRVPNIFPSESRAVLLRITLRPLARLGDVEVHNVADHR